MKNITLAQGNQVLNLILQKDVPCEQLQELLASGLLSDLLDANIQQVDRKKFREVLGLMTVLEQVGIVDLPSTGKFIVNDHFTKDSKEVKFYGFGSNFQENFLSKVEDPQKETILRISNLKKNLLGDAPIIAQLGNTVETALANVWELLKKQSKGELGKLRINGHANIFYVRDAKGVLRAVYVHWSRNGWDVSVNSVEDPLEWGEDERVFSRHRTEA